MKFKDKYPFLAYSLVRIPQLIGLGLVMYIIIPPLTEGTPLVLKRDFVLVILALILMFISAFIDRKVGLTDDIREQN